MRLLSRAVAAAALVCLLGLSTVSSAQAPAPTAFRSPSPTSPPVALPGVTPLAAPELEAFVDGIIRDAIAADHIPGVTVSVVQNGQTILKKGYGFARLQPTARPVDPDRTSSKPPWAKAAPAAGVRG